VTSSLAPASVPHADTSRALARQAIAVLGVNWHGHATVPSRSLYPHQWSWDSAFIALGLQHWAPRRAATELISMLGAQWSDGRVPHIAFNPAIADDAYFPGPSFWRSDDIEGHPPVDTSGIIQPPVHAVAAAAVLHHLGEAGIAFAQRIYPGLVAQNAYLRRCRTAPGSELAFVLHPWETGMDNSPAWDEPLTAVPADLAVFETHTRRDLDHAGEHERPTHEDYSRYIRLAAAYRDRSYDDRWAANHAEFVVLDPGFNALWGWSELALAEIARYLGRDDALHRVEADRIGSALVTELFARPAEAGGGMFYGKDHRTGRWLSDRTVGGLIPLVLPGLPPSVTEALLNTLTGAAFGAGSDRVLGVPSFDLTSPKFDAQRYWRGPSWLNTTWLIGRGLQGHGQYELAERLLTDILSLAEHSGLREYFNPYTGSGHGIDRFSWSAALVLDVLASSGPRAARSAALSS
jgi:hypothetical protein